MVGPTYLSDTMYPRPWSYVSPVDFRHNHFVQTVKTFYSSIIFYTVTNLHSKAEYQTADS